MNDKLFLDTNVVVDLLGERKPHYESVARIATLADGGSLQLIVSALTYATVFYLLSRFEANVLVKEKIRKFKVISGTADLTDKVLEKALASKFRDFEDALQYYCALDTNCNILITRNGKDFKESEIPVMTSEEYLNSLKNR